MSAPVYRVHRDSLNGGRFQVQVRQDPGGQAMWFDAGDPCTTRIEAEAKMAEFQHADARRLPDGTRCGIHGDDTSSGRCQTCDAEATR